MKSIETKPLTENHAIKNKFSGVDCIKYFNPKWSDKECDDYLWDETCFPFSTTILIAQLNEEFINS